jgi:hypothetical protein
MVFVDRWVRTVGPENVSAARRTAITTLVTGLLQDGVWHKLDRLWLLAAENEKSALVDVVGRGLATTVGSPSFTTDRGYTGVDLSNTIYINTNFQLSTAPNYSQNKAHYSVWQVTNIASSGFGGPCGAASGANEVDMYVTASGASNDVYSRINEVGGGSNGTTTSRSGHWLANRDSSSTSQMYRNASLFVSPNITSSAVPALNMFVLNVNVNGNPGNNGCPNQIAMHSIGASLSSTEVTNFYNRLRTYMTAVGVP